MQPESHSYPYMRAEPTSQHLQSRSCQQQPQQQLERDIEHLIGRPLIPFFIDESNQENVEHKIIDEGRVFSPVNNESLNIRKWDHIDGVFVETQTPSIKQTKKQENTHHTHTQPQMANPTHTYAHALVSATAAPSSFSSSSTSSSTQYSRMKAGGGKTRDHGSHHYHHEAHEAGQQYPTSSTPSASSSNTPIATPAKGHTAGKQKGGPMHSASASASTSNKKIARQQQASNTASKATRHPHQHQNQYQHLENQSMQTPARPANAATSTSALTSQLPSTAKKAAGHAAPGFVAASPSPHNIPMPTFLQPTLPTSSMHTVRSDRKNVSDDSLVNAISNLPMSTPTPAVPAALLTSMSTSGSAPISYPDEHPGEPAESASLPSLNELQANLMELLRRAQITQRIDEHGVAAAVETPSRQPSPSLPPSVLVSLPVSQSTSVDAGIGGATMSAVLPPLYTSHGVGSVPLPAASDAVTGATRTSQNTQSQSSFRPIFYQVDQQFSQPSNHTTASRPHERAEHQQTQPQAQQYVPFTQQQPQPHLQAHMPPPYTRAPLPPSSPSNTSQQSTTSSTLLFIRPGANGETSLASIPVSVQPSTAATRTPAAPNPTPPSFTTSTTQAQPTLQQHHIWMTPPPQQPSHPRPHVHPHPLHYQQHPNSTPQSTTPFHTPFHPTQQQQHTMHQQAVSPPSSLPSYAPAPAAPPQNISQDPSYGAQQFQTPNYAPSANANAGADDNASSLLYASPYAYKAYASIYSTPANDAASQQSYSFDYRSASLRTPSKQ